MKTFTQFKHSLVSEAAPNALTPAEKKLVKPLLGKTEDQLLKLKWDKFPIEAVLRKLPQEQGSPIISAYRKLLKSSASDIADEMLKRAQAIIKTEKIKVGSWTNQGQVTFLSPTEIEFSGKYRSKLNGANNFVELRLANLKKLTKAAYDKSKKPSTEPEDERTAYYNRRWNGD